MSWGHCCGLCLLYHTQYPTDSLLKFPPDLRIGKVPGILNN